MKGIILIGALALAPLAHADDSGKASAKSTANVRYQKTTVINFNDDTVEGSLKRPDGEYVDARKTVKHSNLIRIRDNFKDKAMQSVGDL